MENESTLEMGIDAPSDELAAVQQTLQDDITPEPEDAPEKVAENESAQASEVDYAALAEEDLLQLKTEFPTLSDMTSLCELENPARYGELRELGLSAREAYLATTTPKERIQNPYDNRSHLRSAVPRTHGATGEQMSAQQMRAARELFSDLSDSEIVKLYKKVHS